MKGSKDSDYSLVSTQNLSFKNGVGAQGPVTWAKKPKPTPLMTSPTKKREIQNFLTFLIRTRRLGAYFEGLNGSLAQSAGKLRSC